MEVFINKWQTLIGSAAGPFLAVILSAAGFWIKSVIKNRRERKEFLRRIEIGITRSLEDTCKTRIKLQFFVWRLRKLITDIRSIPDGQEFSLETINYPTMRDVYRDIEAPNFKIKSYYLHNKLLWADAGIKETNEIILNLKNDFSELQRKNELLVNLMTISKTPNITQQRSEYAGNLESFANGIDGFTKEFMQEGIEIMIQIKTYNERLRMRWGYWFLWKNEKTRLKYFSCKKEQRDFGRNLGSLNRIDKSIQKEVEDTVKYMAEKYNKSLQNLKTQ